MKHIKANKLSAAAQYKNQNTRFWIVVSLFGLALFFIQTYHFTDLMGKIDGLSVSLLMSSFFVWSVLLGVKFATIISVILFILTLVLAVGGGIYYNLYHSFTPFSLLALASESISLINSFDVLYLMFVLPVIGIISFLFFNILLRLHLPQKKQLIIVGFITLGTALSLQMYHDSRKFKHFVPSSEVSMGYFLRTGGLIPFIEGNPFSERMAKIKTFATAINSGAIKELPESYKDAVKIFYAERKSNDDLYPLQKEYQFEKKHFVNKNVIVIVLESVRASEMGMYGHKNSATPFMDSLSHHSIVAKRFYSTAPLTVKSETAINCGVLDYFGGNALSVRNEDFVLSCVPDILKKNGYNTFWFHGNTREFYNRDDFLPKLGFENIFSIENLYGKNARDEPLFGWGIPDTILFDMALEKLKKEESPFYAEILSVSNHLPFDYDWGVEFPPHLITQDTFYDKYRRGIYYTDFALKGFMEKFKQSKLYDNSVVIITSDHGIWTFEKNNQWSDLNKQEQFFRVPLLIYGKDITPGVITQPASHIDIPPTILSLLGVNANASFLGRSLVDEPEQIVPVFTMLEASYGVRLGDTYCVPANRCFRNGQDECKEQQWKEKAVKKPNIMCYVDDGDVMFKKNSKEIIVHENQMSYLDDLLNYTILALQIGYLSKNEY